jgi:microcompartment protein CcmK/EutM
MQNCKLSFPACSAAHPLSRTRGGAALPDYLIAVDTVDAGPGDRVLVLDEGNGARQVLASKDGPVRSVIVGIVDEVATA